MGGCGAPAGEVVRMTTPEGAARTAIVTVDDDAGVSRAVARDLRRRYGEQHRIVRAESGDAALDALREMRLRGDEVAVIVADYRMPGMNGIEFLERAMDLYPVARRVLLTAYADTGAAIDAINVVDLDHYLLKPWDPPEEKLYPVIDELLSKWQAEDRRPVRVAKVVGPRWSARPPAVREFLARNQVAYRWYDSEEPDGQRLLAAAETDGLRLPVVITPDAEVLVEPADAELAVKLGLATTPAQDFYDVVVIGGGPAGLGAASTTGPRSPRRPPAWARTSTSWAARTPPGRPPSTWPSTPSQSRSCAAGPRWNGPCPTTSLSRSGRPATSRPASARRSSPPRASTTWRA